MAGSKQERKAFFFAKKKQKRLRLACTMAAPVLQAYAAAPSGRPWCRRRRQKSFASFLQKRRPSFLPTAKSEASDPGRRGHQGDLVLGVSRRAGKMMAVYADIPICMAIAPAAEHPCKAAMRAAPEWKARKKVVLFREKGPKSFCAWRLHQRLRRSANTHASRLG